MDWIWRWGAEGPGPPVLMGEPASSPNIPQPARLLLPRKCTWLPRVWPHGTLGWGLCLPPAELPLFWSHSEGSHGL